MLPHKERGYESLSPRERWQPQADGEGNGKDPLPRYAGTLPEGEPIAPSVLSAKTRFHGLYAQASE